MFLRTKIRYSDMIDEVTSTRHIYIYIYVYIKPKMKEIKELIEQINPAEEITRKIKQLEHNFIMPKTEE